MNSSPSFQTLPKAVTQLSHDHPNSTWVTVPKDGDLKTGWRDITYKELAISVKGMAAWIQRRGGLGRRNVDVAAYIGVNDMRYAVVQVALVRAGYQTLLPSPRNSQEGQQSLFESTKCSILLHSENVDAYVDPIKTALPKIKTAQIPTFDELLRLGSNAHAFPPDVPCDEETDRVLILHTSGSTGLPKPIYHTNGSIHTVTALRNLSTPEGRQNAPGALMSSDRPILAATPFFHMMGQALTWRTILNRGPVVRLPADKPVNADLIITVLKQTKPWAGIFPPSLLEEVAGSPAGMEELRQLQYVFFGGGPLASEVGDKLCEVTKLVSIIGSTEAGLMAARIPSDKHDWKYFEWAPESGVDMQPEPDSEGLYEMVIKPVDRRYQGVFHTFPEILEWRTKDLFEQHPAKAGLWLYKGRKDDVLVLSNGEKFNPVGFEKMLESHPLVRGAIVVGQARFQTGLVIEPDWSLVSDHDDPSNILEQVWPSVEKANAASPAHGKVWKSKVAITKREKPFKRTPKGSVIRRHTTQLYEAEIDALYSNEGTEDKLGKLPANADIDTIKKFIRQVFRQREMPIPDSASDEDDIFGFGIDSLQVLAVASTLSHACGGQKRITISPRDVYANPTIDSLAKFLQNATGEGNAAVNESREEIMAQMVDKYTHDLSSMPNTTPTARPEKHNYILTGSTGSLGGHILRQLIDSNDTGHVYCLNRSKDAESRTRESFSRQYGAEPDFSKVTFLQTDFAKPRFGLSLDVYELLLRSVNIFIHNAWSVDFNKTLPSYEETHVAGTRRCVDFSLESKFRSQIVFVSSIASVGGYPALYSQDKEVPEEIFEDHRVTLPQGYGESKHVASLILARAATDAGVPATIIRAGQLAGPSGAGAAWNQHEWLPSIVISSKALGVLPDRLGNQDTVDWVPMDLAAKSVIEISNSRAQQTDALSVAHLVNPRTTSWSQLVPTVQKALQQETGQEIKIVSFRTWLDKLAASPKTADEIRRKPGIKLIDFYEGLLSEGGGLPALSTSNSARLSKTVEGMKPVDSKLMQKWLAQWQE